MKKLALWFQGIFPLLQNMLLPAFIMGAGLLWFYAHNQLDYQSSLNLHIFFYILSFTTFIILFYFNSNKGAFFLLTLVVSYTFLNRIKYQYPDDFIFLPSYINLCVLTPLLLLIYYFIPYGKLIKKYNLYFLLVFFATISIGEFCTKYNLAITVNFLPTDGSISGLSLSIFLISLISFYIKTVITGKILDYSFFFSGLLCFLGFFYSEHYGASSLFFCLSIIIILLGLIEEIYNDILKDDLTGFSSRKAFVIHSHKFPLKYSVSLLRIDNFHNLHKAFGKRGRNKLLRMISNRINQTNTDAHIYRYSEDELILIFKNINKTNALEQTEQIRRAVASADFMLPRHKKAIKLTISGCISEKKRSDAGILEVINRARENLQKATTFSCNIISQA